MNAQFSAGQGCQEGNPCDRLGAMDASAPRCCAYCLQRGCRNRGLLLIQPLWADPAVMGCACLHCLLIPCSMSSCKCPSECGGRLMCFLWPAVVMGFFPQRFSGAWYFSLHCSLSQWGCSESPLSALHLPIFIRSKRLSFSLGSVCLSTIN